MTGTTTFAILDESHQALRAVVAVHAWDLAAAAGLPSPLTAGRAGRLTPIARAIVEPLRDYGVYAAALTPVPGDDETAALLRYLGRAPEWTP
jgi:hypothetical protein